MKFKPMKKIDEFLFAKADEFKGSSYYQRAIDSLGTLEENQQQIIKILTVSLVLLIPLIFILSYRAGNSTIYSNIEARENVFETAQKILQKQQQSSILKRSVVGSGVVTSQGDLQNQINLAVSKPDLISKISLSEYEQSEISTTLGMSSALVKFTSIPTSDLVFLFKTLSTQKKMSFSDINLVRNNDSQMVSGTVRVYFVSER